MSADYQGKDPAELAAQAEQDLNSEWAKGEQARKGKGESDSTRESGVDESVTNKFPGAEVKSGPQASGREVALDEGGDINPKTGQPYKDADFEGTGGPEDKAQLIKENNPGSDDIRENIRN